MPKRVAEEYITKDHGTSSNFDSADDKPKMSTAAQLAKRKIAQPRGRLGANRQSPSPFGGSISSTQPQQQQQPQQTFGSVNGFTFGASQSFPPDNSGSGGGGFGFQPPQSSSFTFGLPSSTASNPFASLNGTTTPDVNNQDDTSMGSPQKKPSFGNVFGAQNGTTNTTSNFTFGQPTQTQPQSNGGISFGSISNNTNVNGGGLFGSSAKPETTSASSNPFASLAQPKQNQLPAFSGFGSPAPASQSEAPVFTFGNPQPAPTTQPSSFSFGQPNKAQETNPAPAQPATTEQKPQQPFFFGKSTTPESSGPPTQQTPFAPQEQAKPPGFSFLPPTSTSQHEPSNMSKPTASFGFGQTQSNHFSSHKPTDGAVTASAETPKAPLFNFQQTASTSERSVSPEKQADSASEPPKNPFAGLFGNVGTTPTAKPLFNLGNSTTPASASENNVENSTATNKPAPGPSFGQSTSQAEKPASAFSFGKPASNPASNGGLFSPAQATSKSNEPSTNIVGAASGSTSPSKPLFQSARATNSTLTKAPDSTSKPASGFGSPSHADSATALEQPSSEPPSKKSQSGGEKSQTNLFDAQSTPKPPKSNSFDASSVVNKAHAPSQQGATDASSSSAQKIDRPVYTKAAPFIPGSLGAEQYRSYDRNYRLHSLNLGLQKKLSGLDPRSYDFDNIVRHYVAARESIGESLGLFERSVAGTKRKTEAVEEHYDDTRNKRTRSENSSQEPVTSSKQNSRTSSQLSQPLFGSSAPVNATASKGNPSKATEMFQGMIPSSSTGQAKFPQPANPFAALPAPSSSPQPTENAKISAPFAGVATPTSLAQDSANSKAANPFASLSSTVSNPPASASTTPKTTTSFGGFTPVPTSTAASATNPFAGLDKGSKLSNSSAAESTTPKKSPSKPAFEVPKFGGSGSNFMAAFGQQAKKNADKFEKELFEKRKAEDFDSDEDDEEAFNKQIEEEKRAKRAKIDALAQGGFTPSFGAAKNTESSKPIFNFGKAPDTSKSSGLGSSFLTKKGTQSLSTGGATSNPFSALNKSPSTDKTSESVGDEEGEDKSGSNDDDTNEDDDDEGEGSPDDSDNQEAEDDLPEDEIREDDEDGDDEEGSGNDSNFAVSANAGKSLFERIEPNPNLVKAETPTPNGTGLGSEDDSTAIFQSAKNPIFKKSLWGSHIGQETPEQPPFSPITPSTTESVPTYKPATTFNFTAPPTASRTPTPGASIFAGGLTKNGPIPGEGMFGSRPSTPSNGEKVGENNALSRSVLASPPGTDNTWKQGAPISFGSPDTAAPIFKFTGPSPSKDVTSAPKPFGTLFGTSGQDSKSSDAPKLGFSFGARPSSPAPGYLGAVSHLGGGSAASSAMSSRATSPGLTDNESVATNDTEESTDPQTSLMDSRAGEENEDCLWEGRSKALMFVNKDTAEGTKMKANDWNSMGVGLARVLQDKTTKKTRFLFRVEPSASILINSHLVESTDYENVPSQKSGAVKGTLLYKGGLTRWVFKVKTPEMAEQLAKILEENKKS